MSWTRAELKARAKAAFKKNYWICVLVSFILCLVGGTSNSPSCNTSSISNNSNSGYYNDYDDYGSDYDSDYNYGSGYDSGSDAGTAAAAAVLGAFSLIVVIIVLVACILGALLSIFVFNPFQVGGCYFFLDNAVNDNAQINGLISGFKSNYKGTVLTMFLRQLYTSLWSLLFIIPGIVKAYEYRMIPYILADHPEMSNKEVFALSKKMMDGEKWNAFVLDLSFYGWILLSSLTCGILAIFYVNPYVNATNAELYLELKRIKCEPAYETYNTYDTNNTAYNTYQPYN